MDYVFLVYVLLKTLKSFKKGLFGGVFGAIKSVFVFGVIYIGLSFVAGITNNQTLASFVQSGQVVNSLFAQVIEKTISVFLPH